MLKISSALRLIATPKPSLKFSSRRFYATPSEVKPLYTKSHEWILVDEKTNVGTVGITNYAQSALGDVVYVDLPSVGKRVDQSGTLAAVESVKAASDIYSPASGEVVAVNKTLADSPALINQSAEKDGWIAKIKLSKTEQLKTLLDAKAYDEHCKSEKH